MARGNDPGRDFDNQYNDSRRKGQERAARGEGPWAQDKYLRDLQDNSGSNGAPPTGGCLILLTLLVTVGLALAGLTGCSAESNYDQCDKAFRQYLGRVIISDTAQEAQALGNEDVLPACEELTEKERERILITNFDLLQRAAEREAELDSAFPS